MGIEIAATADAFGADGDDEIGHRYGEHLSNNAIFDVVFFVDDAALNGAHQAEVGLNITTNVQEAAGVHVQMQGVIDWN